MKPLFWWAWTALLRGLQFSLLSAFHLGFRELNVGNWLARIQAREYGLQAVGWVPVVAEAPRRRAAGRKAARA